MHAQVHELQHVIFGGKKSHNMLLLLM